MAHEYTNLVQRLKGECRIPITDGLGAAGGEEPDNEDEFVRTFDVPPIQREAANIIDIIVAERDHALDAYHTNDGMDGAVSQAIRDLLNINKVPLAAFIDDHVANAIVQRNILQRKLDKVIKLVEDAPTYIGGNGSELGEFIEKYHSEWLPEMKKVLDDTK